jgi:ABC-type multidrug transport system fused ATPase/permease subunit
MSKDSTHTLSLKSQIIPLAKLAYAEIKLLVIASIALLISAGINLLYPKLMGSIIDDLTRGMELNSAIQDHLNQWLLTLTILFLIMGVATTIRSYCFTLAGEKIVINLRAKVFAHLTQQEQAFFDQSHSGQWITRLADDTAKIQRAVTVNLSMLLRYLIAVIGSLGILFSISSSLTLIMLLMIPCITIASTLYGLALRTLSKKVQRALADSGSIASEVLGNIRTVHSFQQEGYEQKRYRGALDQLFELARKRAYLGAYFQGGVSFVSYVSIAIVIWYGGRLMVMGEITLGDLTSFLLYTLTLAFSLSALSGLWEDLSKALGASEDLFTFLQRSNNIKSGSLTPKITDYSIHFHNVSFAYPSRSESLVLQDLNLTIQHGETVAIVGSSGAGKSTLTYLLQRAYDPTKGYISLADHSFESLDLDYLRSHMALVAQEPLLFATTLYENILYGNPMADMNQVQQAARYAFAHDFIMSFADGYQTQVGERGIRLSGGQKQRIAIARAILKNPKFLLLDEATSALDSESEYYVQQALNHVMNKRTCLVIAHRLATVKEVDRIIVLSEGKVSAVGTHEYLMKSKDHAYALWVEQQSLVTHVQDFSKIK